MRNDQNRETLIEILKTYSLTAGDAAFYSKYTSNYICQCKLGFRTPTKILLTNLIKGLIRSYSEISKIDADITQKQFAAKLKQHNVLPRHLYKILPYVKNTIASQLYRLRKGILCADLFLDIASQVTYTMGMNAKTIGKKYEHYL
jgi:Gpi18-like mannosyltransferase